MSIMELSKKDGIILELLKIIKIYLIDPKNLNISDIYASQKYAINDSVSSKLNNINKNIVNNMVLNTRKSFESPNFNQNIIKQKHNDNTDINKSDEIKDLLNSNRKNIEYDEESEFVAQKEHFNSI